MTKFCDGCPNRGNVQGDIEGAFLATGVEYRVKAAMGRGAIVDSHCGDLVIAYDRAYNLSQPFKVPYDLNGDVDKASNLLGAIVDACPGPVVEKRGLLKRREVVSACGSTALNSLILHPDMRRHFRQQIEIAALPFKFNSD